MPGVCLSCCLLVVVTLFDNVAFLLFSLDGNVKLDLK